MHDINYYVSNAYNFLVWHISRNGVVEARAMAPRTYAGWFDDPAKLIKTVWSSDPPRARIPYGQAPRDGEVPAWYFTLNAVDADLMARANNRVVSSRNTTSDADITAYRLLLIDADPQRPAGISSIEPRNTPQPVLYDV